MTISSPGQKAVLAAATLATGTTIDRWSRLAALASLIALIAIPERASGATTALCLSLLAGLAQMYHAMRTALDEKVLAAWGARWARDDDGIARDLADFDAALHELHGKTPTSRDLDARIAGALRLLKMQAAAMGVQTVLLMLAMALRYLVNA